MDNWKPINSFDPNNQQPTLLFNREWIDEDFNPNGVVEGFMGGEGHFIAAVWNDCQDCYETENITPTHWQPLPEPPKDTQDA